MIVQRNKITNKLCLVNQKQRIHIRRIAGRSNELKLRITVRNVSQGTFAGKNSFFPIKKFKWPRNARRFKAPALEPLAMLGAARIVQSFDVARFSIRGGTRVLHSCCCVFCAPYTLMRITVIGPFGVGRPAQSPSSSTRVAL